MQNRNPGESSKRLTPTCGAWKQHKITPLLSIARAKRNDCEHQPLRKSGSLLVKPNIFFAPYQTSREAISALRLLKKAVLPHGGGRSEAFARAFFLSRIRSCISQGLSASKVGRETVSGFVQTTRSGGAPRDKRLSTV